GRPALDRRGLRQDPGLPLRPGAVGRHPPRRPARVAHSRPDRPRPRVAGGRRSWDVEVYLLEVYFLEVHFYDGRDEAPSHLRPRLRMGRPGLVRLVVEPQRPPRRRERATSTGQDVPVGCPGRPGRWVLLRRDRGDRSRSLVEVRGGAGRPDRWWALHLRQLG